tara:strand:+ start:211 stop:456 length:246 start_codon:yes stop_codon:yes gene_type:complete
MRIYGILCLTAPVKAISKTPSIVINKNVKTTMSKLQSFLLIAFQAMLRKRNTKMSESKKAKEYRRFDISQGNGANKNLKTK